MPFLVQNRCSIASTIVLLATLAPLPAQSYANVTATAGITNVPLSNGGDGSGLCGADFDGDGDLDIVVPGTIGTPIRYFRNDGGMSFSDQTALAGLPNALDPRGVVAADIDNDGDADFLITNWRTPLQLFINNGNGSFSEQAIARGLVSQTSAHTASFGDYDRDGWLDLYIANRQLPLLPVGEPNLLYRNLGHGFFQDVSVAAGADHAGLTYSAPFCDYDEDGWPDIYCANDKGILGVPNTMLRNNRDGSFSDVGPQLNASQIIDGMGADFVDVFNDGGVDIYCTDTPVDHLFLRWDPVTSTYVEDTYTYGLTGGGVGWAVNWFDFDNDGWQDLHVVQNGVPNLLYRNPGTPAAAQVPWPEVGFAGGLGVIWSQYAAIHADLDNDGGVDVVNRYAHSVFMPGLPGCSVHHNLTPRGNWLKFRMRGVASNRDGIGARIEVETGNLTQRQHVRNGVGYLSGSDPRAHFGLGTALQADRVTITWPSGQVQVLHNITANQIFDVVEPSFTLTAPLAHGGTSTLDLSIQGDHGLLYGMVLAFAATPRSMLPDGRFLPLQLDALSNYTFIPGNTLLLNPLGLLDANGHATSTIAMPNQPLLIGLTLFATAATVAPQGLPAIKTIFPAPCRITIQ